MKKEMQFKVRSSRWGVRSKTLGFVVAILVGQVIVLLAPVPAEAVDPAMKCQSSKIKVTAKYVSCRLKADAKAALKSLPADYSKCVLPQKLSGKWGAAETKAAGNCPTTVVEDGDLFEMTRVVDAYTARTTSCLAGAKCTAFGPMPATGQTSCWDGSGNPISCAGSGHDGDTLAGGALSFADNGDGTVSDLNTGLMWEKKSDDDSLHDKDNFYHWDESYAPTDIWTWIAKLNNTCANDESVDCTAGGDTDCLGVGGTCGFAGHRDWRIPNVKELQSIVNYEIPFPGPVVTPVFNASCAPGCTVTTCSCTDVDYHWSSSTFATVFVPETEAWVVGFRWGEVRDTQTHHQFDVRAVRGGS